MERDLGAEIVRTFGARLQRLYERDERGLPEQMLACLERLKRAEEQRQALSGSPSQAGSDEDTPACFPGFNSPAIR